MTDSNPSGGIKVRNLHSEVQNRLFAAAGQAAQVGLRPGVNAVASLYVPANVVNGDTITIGADTFEVDIINTTTGTTNVGAVSATQDPTLITTLAAPTIAPAAGDLLRIGNEILKIVRVVDTKNFVCARARCGTTIASHLTAQTVYQSDAPPTTTIPVGLVGTLTPAVFSPALVAEFTNAKSSGSGGRPTTLASTEYANFTAQAIGSGAAVVGGVVLFTAIEAGVNTTATTEEFANSTDNVWGAATFTGGVDPAVVSQESVSRVPTSAEALDGQFVVAFPFTVRTAHVAMRITSTGQQVFFNGSVQVAMVESTDVVLPASTVTLRNVGPASTAYISSFDTTHTITVTAWE